MPQIVRTLTSIQMLNASYGFRTDIKLRGGKLEQSAQTSGLGCKYSGQKKGPKWPGPIDQPVARYYFYT